MRIFHKRTRNCKVYKRKVKISFSATAIIFVRRESNFNLNTLYKRCHVLGTFVSDFLGGTLHACLMLICNLHGARTLTDIRAVTWVTVWVELLTALCNLCGLVPTALNLNEQQYAKPLCFCVRQANQFCLWVLSVLPCLIVKLICNEQTGPLFHQCNWTKRWLYIEAVKVQL
jgi:hypothetical protein